MVLITQCTILSAAGLASEPGEPAVGSDLCVTIGAGDPWGLALKGVLEGLDKSEEGEIDVDDAAS